MSSSSHRDGRASARAIAIFGAALILVSQAIGAAHFHDGVVSRGRVAATQLGVDEGLCPICQLAFHSPGSLAAAPAIVRGPVIAEVVFFALPILPAPPVLSAARVRAPPISL